MRPRRLWTPVIAAALLGLSAGSGAETREDVVIDIIGGVEGATPIAIVPFGREGGAAPETELAPIISANLARTGRFDLLPEQDHVAMPTRLDEVELPTWRASGVDHLVVGGMQPAGSDADGVEVRYELVDLLDGSRTDGRRYRVTEQQMRDLAHTISDRVYETITGREGAFTAAIAYVAVEEQGDGEREHRLVVADADGHRPRTVLTSSEPLLSPAWSPSRDRLAYVSFEGQRSEIFVQDLRTGERERVASFQGINSAPAWSPDGERLAVTLSRDGAANIHLIDVATGETSRLTEHWAIDTEATWAPDGSAIYFTSDRGGAPQVYRVSPEGGPVERVSYEGDYNARPAISPDGERMAMVHRHDGDYYIAVQDLDSESVRIISDGPADESPSFAPNGDMVIYTAGGTEGARLETASVLGDAVAPLDVTEQPGTRVREPAW